MNDPKAGFIGKSVARKEDYRFLTGGGQYTDDVSCRTRATAVFLRSPHAHAKIRKIDTGEGQKAAPGVVAIFTGEDLAGVNGLPCGWLITDIDGKPMKEPPHPVLAQGKVRYVGDQVALVVAETLAQAKDAAELIDVDYEVLPAVVDSGDALKGGRRRSTTARRTTSATSGRWATRRRSTRRSPRRRTSRSSTSSTTG